jgi:ribonuclease T
MHDNVIRKRFDGFLPVVIDVETGGGNSQKDALLEIAVRLVDYNDEGLLAPQQSFACHVIPFEGSRLQPEAMAVNKIDPYHPFRFAIPESQAIEQLFEFVAKAVEDTHCRRAILVGHNAHFDLGFIQAAAKRCKTKNNPFHTYTVFDTATLGGLVYEKTVLAKVCRAAKIKFNAHEAHSAIYDTDRTAELFCKIINTFAELKSRPIFDA